jgi:hypothetical protein
MFPTSTVALLMFIQPTAPYLLSILSVLTASVNGKQRKKNLVGPFARPSSYFIFHISGRLQCNILGEFNFCAHRFYRSEEYPVLHKDNMKYIIHKYLFMCLI